MVMGGRRFQYPGGDGPSVDAHPDPEPLPEVVGQHDARGDHHQVQGQLADLQVQWSKIKSCRKRRMLK